MPGDQHSASLWGASSSTSALTNPDSKATLRRGLAELIAQASQPLVSCLATPLAPEEHHVWTTGDRVIIRLNGSATSAS